jgi:hypothetical protein
MVREIVGVAVGVNVLKIGFDGFGGLVKDATLQSSS